MGYTVIAGGERRCIICCLTLGVDEFTSYTYTTKQGKRSSRRESRCKSCCKIRRKARYARNPEKSKAQSRAWKELNPEHLAAMREARRNEAFRAYRRASESSRRSQRDVSASEAASATMQALSDARVGNLWLDAYTGKLISDPTIDHIVPVSGGGSHGYENLCVTSRRNNTSKHALPLLVWLILRGAK